MKAKFTFLILLTALFSSLRAQQVPNGNFDYWNLNPFEPNGWVTYDGLFGDSLGFSYEDMVDKVDTIASVKLVSDSIQAEPSLGVLSSVLSLGTATYTPIVDTNGPIFTGIPFAFRPDTLFFDYQYTTTGSDSPGILIQFTNAGQPILFGLFQLSPESSWVTEFITLDSGYSSNTVVPDTILIQFYSSTVSKPVKGSTLHVDGVRFGYINATGIEAVAEKLQLQVFPNPTSNTLNIKSEADLSGYKLFVTDINGRAVALKTLTGNTNLLDVSNFASGTYIYRLADQTDKFIYQDKFIVVR